MLTQPLSPRGTCARPNSAPAYYQGRPATFWITRMSAHGDRAAAHAQAAGPESLIPRQRQPQAGETVPPAPRLSAVRWRN
jgi:hypothetical protein